VVEDLQKMALEPRIRDAGLALLVMSESTEVLKKDLALFERVMVEKGVLAGFRVVRVVPILERIGHRQCAVALFPTIQR